HPRLNHRKIAVRRRPAVAPRSRTVARSGNSPTYQKMAEMVKYVLIAKKSQMRGDLKLTQSGPRAYGKGIIQNPSQARPLGKTGNNPAHMTAKSVMASAARLTDVRQRCRNRNRMAEISVPAWPIPIQNTKFVMSNAQPTDEFNPHVPMPVAI